MQTFLPFPDIYKSAQVLDDKRLNKQIVEAFQIYTDRVPSLNHPACLMWRDNKPFLRMYINACCGEYYLRFGKVHKIDQVFQDFVVVSANSPSWFGNPLFHYAHRVNLLRKNPDFYHSWFSSDVLFGDEPEGYYWPTAKEGKKAWKDSNNWLAWGDVHGIKGIGVM